MTVFFWHAAEWRNAIWKIPKCRPVDELIVHWPGDRCRPGAQIRPRPRLSTRAVTVVAASDLQISAADIWRRMERWIGCFGYPSTGTTLKPPWPPGQFFLLRLPSVAGWLSTFNPPFSSKFLNKWWPACGSYWPYTTTDPGFSPIKWILNLLVFFFKSSRLLVCFMLLKQLCVGCVEVS